MGLDTDTHDQVPLATSARLTPEEQAAARAFVARNARDDDDRDLLLAALGLARPLPLALFTAASAALAL